MNILRVKFMLNRNIFLISFLLFKVLTLINLLSHAALVLPVLGYQFLDITRNPIISWLFISHILTWILAWLHGYSKRPSVLGALSTVFGFIPFIGWFLHLITAIVTAPMTIRLIFFCRYSKIYRPISDN